MWILALNPLFILVLKSFVHPRPENLLMCPLQAKLNALMVDAGHMLKTCKQMGAQRLDIAKHWEFVMLTLKYFV